MVGIDTEQVLEVAFEAIPKVVLGAVRVLFDQHRVGVARLRETVELVLGAGRCTGLEHEPDFRTGERGCVEIAARAGDREVEAAPRRKEAVAQVEPKRMRLARLYRKGEVEHVAHGPERILHPEVEREERSVRRLDAQGG